VCGLASRVLFVLGCLGLFAPSAPAQEPHVFHADADLPGYEAAGFSEWSDLYVLDEFKSREGQALAAAELEALRARWKAEQERAGKRIAEIQADPRERWVWQFGKRIARHSYFSKIGYTIERPEPGFVILLQRPAKEDPGYNARVMGFYMPFVKRMAANFDALVAKPAGLVRREDQPVTAFAVLASKGDLENFERFVNDPSGYTTGTAYDYQLQLAVAYEDSFSGISVVTQRASLLYQVAKELQHAHLGVPGNRPGSIWMYEGLAFLLAMHDGNTPDSLDKHVITEGASACIVDLLQKDPQRKVLLFSIDEIAQVRSWDDYNRTVIARAEKAGVDELDPSDVVQSYYAQCELWAHFLLDGAQAQYRQPYLEFQKLAFRGAGDAEAVRRAFPGTDLRALSRTFLGWVCDEFERSHPGKKADRTPISALFTAAGTAGAPDAADAPVSAEPAFSPQMLAPAAEDADAQLGLALGQARAGDIAGALVALRALAPLAQSPPWPERIAREIARLEELAKLREGYLAFLKSSGAKLSVKHKGKDTQALVVSVEGGLVKLGENKLGLASIPLVEVDPYEIAKVAAKKEQQGGAQPWARFYAYAIAGDARWEKLLKDDAPGAKELRADAKQFPAILSTGALARELCELSKLPLPAGAADARALLVRIKTLLADQKSSDLLARRKAELRQLASACLEATRAPGDATGLLHAKSEPMADGRTRFTWEFDAPEEAADWVRDPGYLKSWHDSFPKVSVGEADSRLQVKKGQLAGTGQACYRSAASFSGPVKVQLRYRYVSMAAEHGPAYFCLLVCDDGAGSYIVAADQGFIHVRDLKESYDREARASDRSGYYEDEDLEFEVVHDGKEVATTLDQKPLTKAGCGPRKSGSVVLFMHMDSPLEIERIVVEGKLPPESLHELGSHWIAEQLTALGFH